MGLVALVQSTGEGLGVHRTYLTAMDEGPRDPQRASKGAIWGGAIRLAPTAPEIVIGEGVETSASAGLLLGLPAWAATLPGTWARG